MGADDRARETGRRVQVITGWLFWPYPFLDRASVEEQHRRVAELDDPVLVPAIHADPIVVPYQAEEPRLSDEALADALLGLLAATRRARLAGFTVQLATGRSSGVTKITGRGDLVPL